MDAKTENALNRVALTLMPPGQYTPSERENLKSELELLVTCIEEQVRQQVRDELQHLENLAWERGMHPTKRGPVGPAGYHE